MLGRKNEKLDHYKKVLELNNKLNSTLKLDELLGIIMETAGEVMNSEAASLMLLDEETQELVFQVALGSKGAELKEKFRVKVGEGISGTVAQTGKPLVINDVQSDKRFAKRFDSSTGFQTKAVICTPLLIKDKVIGVLQAINPKKKKEFTDDDLELFLIFSNQAALAVDNARLHQNLVDQEKLKQTIELAHTIQQSFLPKLKESTLLSEVAADNIPALGVGGDLYDAFDISDKKTFIILGDVSGKGVPAALYMVRALSEARFLAPACQNAGELIEKLNKRLCPVTNFGMFITLSAVYIDHEKKVLDYGSAGHYPVIYRNSSLNKISKLEHITGIPVGIDPDAKFSFKTMPYQEGDEFYLYSDGIIEARNTLGIEYGLNQLIKDLEKSPHGAWNSLSYVFSKLSDYCKSAKQHDDMAFLAASLK